MLKDILNIIYKSRMYSRAFIARELKVSEDLVESGVNRLIQMNYLKEEESAPSCGGSCTSCPMANCNGTLVKTYVLTDKGMASLS